MTSRASIGRTAWLLSLPIMFAELSETILHVTDTALLGRVGEVELGSLALIDTILAVSLVLVLGIADAMQIAIARRAGEGSHTEIGRTFTHGLVLVVAVSVIVAIALKLLAGGVAALVTESPAVADAVERYLGLAVFGLPFFAASIAYSSFFVGVARTAALAGATVVLGLINLVLGYGLILGRLGLPRLGLEGAAIASVGGEIAAAVFLTIAVLRYKERVFQMPHWDPSLVKKMLRLGAPVVLYGAIEAAQWLGFFIVVERLGPAPLAWSNVIYAALLVVLIPGEGLAEVAITWVSNTVGSGRLERVREGTRQLISAAAWSTVPLGAVAVFAPGLVFAAFGAGNETAAGASTALQIIGIGALLAAHAITLSGAISGTGDTATPAAIDGVAAGIAVAGAFTVGIILDMNLAYVWATVVLSWLFAAVLSYIWLNSGRWMERSEV